jgi:putative tricarboxylic transport membrane protein
MKGSDATGGILLFFFGAITAALSLRMPIGTFRAAGTGLFPLSLGLLLMVLASMFLLALRVQAAPQSQREAGTHEAPESLGQMLLFLGAIILATLLLKPLGYPLSALVLLLALLRILGVTQWRVNLIISGVTTGVAYLVFVHWLKIPLPMGWLGR